MHALLRLQLHQLGLLPSKPPDASGWRALLEELSATYARSDDESAGMSKSPSREMRFRMSQEPNRTVFEWCPAPLVLYNPATLEILDVNAAATQAYGYEREELLAMRMSDLSEPHPQDASAAETLATGHVVRGRMERHRRKDGSIAEVNVTAHIMSFGGRSVALGIYTDVTETRRLEEQLRQSQKMEAVGRLAGGIAHDFNNLIGAILSYAEVTAHDLGATHPLTPDVLEIAKAARRAAALTQQLLAFSRQQPYLPKLLSLDAVVTDMERMLERMLGGGIELTIARARDIGPILADPVQIQQVLLNLTVNARDAMSSGGRLRVGLDNVDLPERDAAAIGVTAGPYVRLSFRDTGEGMDKATRARVFEPFFTTKPPGAGTGLGLAIVFGVAKQTGGAVTVESQPGKGSTFEVYFPRASGVVPSVEAVLPEPTHVVGAERVLLVDDDDQMRGAARRVLQSQGYSVLDVADPREALDLLRDPAFDVNLVVTDVVMPHMDGHALVTAARKTRPALRVLFMSGYSTLHRGAAEPSKARDEALLRKPFSTSTLASAVRRALA